MSVHQAVSAKTMTCCPSALYCRQDLLCCTSAGGGCEAKHVAYLPIMQGQVSVSHLTDPFRPLPPSAYITNTHYWQLHRCFTDLEEPNLQPFTGFRCTCIYTACMYISRHWSFVDSKLCLQGAVDSGGDLLDPVPRVPFLGGGLPLHSPPPAHS